MKTIGLTGGIGMGKSVAEELLQKQGVPVVDTDRLARELVRPGQPALEEIVTAFGAEVLGQDGELDRQLLGRRVFADEAARQRLEEILHPRIRAQWRRRFRTWAAQNKAMAVVVIPLLFETGAEEELDVTICVACSRPTQHRRLLGRGWTPEQINQRLAAQWPIEKKMAAADFVIWNDSSLHVLHAQIHRILRLISSRGSAQGVACA